MFDSILDSLKGEVAGALTDKLGLNDTDIDKTISSSKEALTKTVETEAKGNGIEGMLSLFSDNENSGAANGLLEGLGGNLISSLSSNGFSSDKASSIKDQILPVILSLVTKNIGGDSNKLTSLLSSGGISDIASGLVKDKASGFLKGLFK